MSTHEVATKNVGQVAKLPSFIKGIIDAAIILVMCYLLMFGASYQMFKTYTDVAKYQCYTVAFWHGLSALKTLPSEQCHFIFETGTVSVLSNQQIAQTLQHYHFPAWLVHFVQHQPTATRFHALPREYPFINIFPFSLALLAPSYYYQVAFGLCMACVAVVMYLLLLQFRSRPAAIACAFYLVAGGWATAAGRFDLIPSMCTLIALLFAVRKHWNWAFAFLALGVMSKFYPVVLLIPLLLAQQMASRERWYSWRRWSPSGIFIVVAAVLSGLSLYLNVEGTVGQLSYFGNRPVQVESLLSSFLWIGGHLGFPIERFQKTYGSLNVFSPLSSVVSVLGTLMLLGGLLYTYWLQWRGKIGLPLSYLLTLLIVIATGKVFSPQYMIWVAPLVAYVSEGDLRWAVPWGIVSLLTTWIYPVIYNMKRALADVPTVPLFYPIVTLRNLLLLAFVVALLIYGTRQGRKKPSPDSVPELDQPSSVAIVS